MPPSPEELLLSNARIVNAAITSRMSIRAFAPHPVARETLTELLRVASRAPSGTNTQPWQVYVLQGGSRERLVQQVCAAHNALRANPELADQYHDANDPQVQAYYPKKWFSPYLERRRENGWGLYGLLGIAKGEKDKMHAQQQRNYRFFDAPVGLIFTIHRALGTGSLLDYGMFMQNLMVAARGYGLHTCAQASWRDFSNIVLPHVGAGTDEVLVCGMALGYGDETQTVNSFHTPRLPVENFTHWLE